MPMVQSVGWEADGLVRCANAAGETEEGVIFVVPLSPDRFAGIGEHIVEGLQRIRGRGETTRGLRRGVPNAEAAAGRRACCRQLPRLRLPR